MRLPTSEEMAELDRRAAEEFGVPTLALMEAAGRAVATAAARMVSAAAPQVVVAAGKGHNGGDALVAARYLRQAGWRPRVILLAGEEEIRGDASVNLHAARQAGVEITTAGADVGSRLRDLLAGADLVIDGLFGTGLRGPVTGQAAEAIAALNAAPCPVLAIDIPSGVQGDTGLVEGPAVRAAVTVTMALPKPGLVLAPGAGHAGRVWVADIGHPRRLLEEAGIRTSLVTRAMVDDAIPARRLDTHKGDCGRVLVVAGSVGHSGAAALAVWGALRSGAGLVTLAVPASIYPIVGPVVVEGMPVPLPDRDGALAAEAAEGVLRLAGSADVLACGPGLGTGAGPTAVVRRILADCPRPVVLDADALTILAESPGGLPAPRATAVLTPHPGEMARLMGWAAAAVQRDRLAAARVAAARYGAVVVLKGARTVVADPSGQAFVVPTGNPAMATGGMGDVLTGAIAALIGQGVPVLAAAWCGAYLHGLAGDLAASDVGPAGVLAREVADRMPAALAAVRSGTAPDPVSVLSVQS